MDANYKQVLALGADGPIDASFIAESLDVNHRYGRELIGLGLAQKDLYLVEAADGDEYHTSDEGKAALELDRVASQPVKSVVQGATTDRKPSKRKERKMTKTTGPATTHPCHCNCGLDTISPKAKFRPGHDARMVSNLAQAVVGSHTQSNFQPLGISDAEFAQATGSEDIQFRIDVMADRINAAYSPALGFKFHAAAMNAWAKYDRTHNLAPLSETVRGSDAKAAKAEKTTSQVVALDGVTAAKTIKIGRWEYPVREVLGGGQERNTKRDGSGEWVAV